MSKDQAILDTLTTAAYPYGFESNLPVDQVPVGLNEGIIRLISEKKEEPEWLLNWRLSAYRHWLTMKEPDWAHIQYTPIKYQDIIYNSFEDLAKHLNIKYSTLTNRIYRNAGKYGYEIII